ncbi:MAG: TldD/PmbA family protein [Gemmatimonadota bacterium]|nr:TldD/PmbA family protein [Gemmatimonadota bacterium]MDH3366776.1 TldD/PmbA family protein [Gemmatimonadota bacterium]MDH3479380.1 TldD/PmbA family protein [Gemmatimonadota bacterium]MDH3569065.1 TldD/PmbA family protein [Gemmatimonadota bacterium]MDH5548892.1 TldD/PmbA family protein [Gemmatimonadota bacterium]
MTAVMADLLTEGEARTLCERALRRITADASEVRVVGTMAGNTRAAVNRITTGGDVSDLSLVVSAWLGARGASVATNRTDDRGLAAAAEQVMVLARLAPEDPEHMALPSDQRYAPIEAFFPATAGLEATTRVDATVAMLNEAKEADLVGSSYVSHEASARAIANSAGLFAYHRATAVSLSTTVRTADGRGSGWAGATHNDWERVGQAQRLARVAVDKARASVNVGEVEPGAFTVVLEPTAVADLLRLLPRALDARTADEGRSPFSAQGGGTKAGERVVSPRVTIFSDPADPDLLTVPFTDEGLAIPRTTWIEEGILRNLASSRYWADRQGRAPTPLGGGLKMAGGNASLDALIGGIERGLLITRFWYVRAVDPRTLHYTGLTRDGTFRIEGGRITGAVPNLRFNESLLGMLERVTALGVTGRTLSSGAGDPGPAIAVPPIVVDDFHFTSVSDAI